MTAMDMMQAVTYVQSALREQADPEKAAGMQAYMKTGMPFYGVQKPGRTKILRHIRTEYVPTSREQYEDLVTALWELPHREELSGLSYREAAKHIGELVR